MKERRQRSIYFIDISVPPKCFTPMSMKWINVFVYNIDDLKSIVEENMSRRKKRYSVS